MLTVLVAFVGVSVLVIVTPGQDTALTVRNTLAGGRRAGWGTALGVAAGQAVWTTATSLGLAGILLAWQPAFLLLKIVGAVYLAWLALHALRDALFPPPVPAAAGAAASAPPSRRLSPPAAFRTGILSNLGNPKMVVFFLSVLPQFAPRDAIAGTVFAALGVRLATLSR